MKALPMLALLASAGLAGQTVLEDAGKPIRVEFQCTLDDLQSSGMSCTGDQPCPVYLELTAVESVGNRIFAAGNIHSDTSTLYSVLLASDDAGKTWHEPFDRIRGAGLDHIQFLDFENGWISGQVLQPLPLDPFLLITSDGGKTWRRRPLFEDTKAGVIVQYWFTSRTAGSLVLDRGQGGEGDRYELYETANGGESWAVRQTSAKPFRLRRVAGESAAWRIRADAATRAFLVERHDGERWSALAAFSVALRPCVPLEPQ